MCSQNKNLANYTSVLAVIISMFAVILSFCNNKAFITHNQLSVSPILQFGEILSPNENEFLNLRIKNVGVGPAIIDSAIIKYKGNIIDFNSRDLNLLSGEETGFYLYARGIIPSQVIPSGDEFYIFRALKQGTVSGEQTLNTREFFKDIHVRVFYSSIYKIRNDCSYH